MNPLHTKLYQLAQSTDLSQHSLRSIGRELDPAQPVHPETVKYYWKKLYHDGLIAYPPKVEKVKVQRTKFQSKIDNDTSLVTIPVYGAADCGPATKLAEQTPSGELRVTSSFLPTRRYSSLYALKASGNSMNQASVHGRPIQDGDYVVVDGDQTQPKNGEYVVVIMNDAANIKQFYRESDRIALLSESSENFDPIFVHPEDQSDALIGGKVIQVVPKPRSQ